MSQLPMNLPGVGRWYADAARHGQSSRCSNDDKCAGCNALRARMAELREKYADKLVTL